MFESGVINALRNVTFLSNKKSIVVETFDSAVTQVDNFCENELIPVMFKLFDGRDASLVPLKPEHNGICLFKRSNMLLQQ